MGDLVRVEVLRADVLALLPVPVVDALLAHMHVKSVQTRGGVLSGHIGDGGAVVLSYPTTQL